MPLDHTDIVIAFWDVGSKLISNGTFDLSNVCITVWFDCLTEMEGYGECLTFVAHIQMMLHTT